MDPDHRVIRRADCTTTVNFINLCQTVIILIYMSDSNNTDLERRGSVVVSTSVWHAAGRWFDSRTRHVSLLGVKTWLSTGIVYL